MRLTFFRELPGPWHMIVLIVFTYELHTESSVQSLNHIWPFATPWTAAYMVSLSITNSQSPSKPMSTISVMPSSHLILCCPLLLDRKSTRLNSRNWWWTGRPSVLQFMGLQRVGHDWVTELNWKESYVLKSWYFWTLVLEKTLQKPLDGKEINPVN